MSERRELLRYCKRRLHKGRSGFSRGVDYAAVRLIAFMGCYIYFSAIIANDTARLLLAIVTTVFISISIDLINSLRLDGFIAKERRRAAEEALFRRLLYLTDSERMQLIREYVRARPSSFEPGHLLCTSCKSAGLGEEDVLRALRRARERGSKRAYIFHTGKPTREAFAAASSCPEVDVSFVDIRAALTPDAAKRLTPSEEEVTAALLTEARMERERLRSAFSSPFASGRAKRYLMAAVCIGALSFFVEYALYYRLMAAACLLFAAASWWLERSRGINAN